MLIRKVPFLILIVSLLLIVQSVHAAPMWQIEIEAGMGSTTNRIVIGADTAATDGFEFEWDTIALLGGEVEVYFLHPEWNQTHDAFQKDIRLHEPGTVKEWTFKIEVVDPDPDDGLDPVLNYLNKTFTVDWGLSNIPGNYPLVLTDEGNSQQINMRTQTSYNFTYTALRSFRVAVTMPAAVNYNPFDNNPADWKIDDFELLSTIDGWASGAVDDFELLLIIDLWAAGSYCWDAVAGAYKTAGC